LERKFGADRSAQRHATGDHTEVQKTPPIRKTPSGLPALNINLEVHLPADVRPEVYDAIFSSMRKHLIDVE
jgi:hypothetical protein